MSNKLLYFDTETTGLDPETQDIIQIAGIVVIDGKEMETFEFKCKPFSFENVSQEALDVHGYQRGDLEKFPEPQEMYKSLISIFEKYIDRYNKNDKFIPAGYNVRFDMEMLSEFFIKNKDIYFGSWLNWRMIDPMYLLHFLSFIGYINLPDHKLETACKHFGIQIQAHDALSDIRATRELTGLLYKNYIIKKEQLEAA